MSNVEIQFKDGRPIITDSNIETALKQMQDHYLAYKLFGDEKPKKKQYKKLMASVKQWHDLFAVYRTLFNTVVKSSVEKTRARQDVDMLIVNVSCMIREVMIQTKPGPNKETLRRAADLLDYIRREVGWDIKQTDDDEPEDEDGAEE